MSRICSSAAKKATSTFMVTRIIESRDSGLFAALLESVAPFSAGGATAGRDRAGGGEPDRAAQLHARSSADDSGPRRAGGWRCATSCSTTSRPARPGAVRLASSCKRWSRQRQLARPAARPCLMRSTHRPRRVKAERSRGSGAVAGGPRPDHAYAELCGGPWRRGSLRAKAKLMIG
jgi:hypothetical protein